jgi:tetratricopeptide (TPR) repeat protein
LDTRAVIYLETQQFGEAIKDLSQAIELSPSTSRYFHLARAWKAIADREKARGAKTNAAEASLKKAEEAWMEAWSKAQDLGLQRKLVHRLEREQYDKLRQIAP